MLLDLVILFSLLLVVYLVWQHVNIRGFAMRSAIKACRKEGVQFLDQTIILRSLTIASSPHSLFALKRKFTFEFSSVGDSRYQGAIVVLGRRVVSCELEPYKILQ